MELQPGGAEGIRSSSRPADTGGVTMAACKWVIFHQQLWVQRISRWTEQGLVSQARSGLAGLNFLERFG
eukprot:6149698-Pyramimonas_sp.AAC.1